MISSLPKIEIAVYFFVYLVFLIHGFRTIFQLCENNINGEVHDFPSGWKILNRTRDDYDNEWETLKIFLLKYFHWYLVHLICSEISRIFYKKHICMIYAATTIGFFIINFQLRSIFLIFMQFLTTYCVSRTNSPKFIWFYAIVSIFFINYLKTSSYFPETLNFEEYYSVAIGFSWNILKCISFSIDRHVENDVENKFVYNFEYLAGYFFYFPTYIFGPFMNFERFLVGAVTSNDKDNGENFERIVELLKFLLKITIWMILSDFALHYLYVNYLKQNEMLVKRLDLLALYGFGFLMGLFFCNFYKISYGIGISIAKFDGMNPPNLPKCIGRIHFYSDMWKYFDQGLYEFLFRYIYAALCTKTSQFWLKLLSSLATFIFIYIWHGFFLFIFIWSAMNFLCLFGEKLFKQAVQTESYQKFVKKHLSEGNQCRLFGVLGAQIFIPATISNFYFFAGIDIGNQFVQRTYFAGIFTYAYLTFFCYCVFQCSEFIWEWERQEKNKRISMEMKKIR